MTGLFGDDPKDEFVDIRNHRPIISSFLPAYIDPELWAAFVESRKAMKVPFTPLAQKLIVKKLMGMHANGWDVNASLEKSATYGYRGVFEVERRKVEKDPALAKIKEDAVKAAPMPGDIRKKIAELTGRKIQA